MTATENTRRINLYAPILVSMFIMYVTGGLCFTCPGGGDLMILRSAIGTLLYYGFGTSSLLLIGWVFAWNSRSRFALWTALTIQWGYWIALSLLVVCVNNQMLGVLLRTR
jgi:hypothetical protein